MAEPFVPVRVRCYAGYRSEEMPRSLELEGREVPVDEVLDRWLEPGGRYFRVRAGDDVFLLRHAVDGDRWELRREGSPKRGAQPSRP